MKKKKLTINALAGSNLRKRKKQYAIMFIGIILAMVFSSSIIFFLSCLQTSLDESNKNLFGAQNEIYFDADIEKFNTLKEDGLVQDYGIATVIGNAYTDELGADYAQAVACFDDKAKELSYQKFIEGSYPQNENEIAMEASALSKLAPNAKVGDQITLKLHSQNGMDMLSDEFSKTYTLVGIAKNKKANIDFNIDAPYFSNYLPTVFVCENSKTQIGGKELLLSYYKQADSSFLEKHGYINFYAVLDDKNYGLSPENSLWASSSSYYNDVVYELTEKMVFIILFAVVLLLASAMVIVNAFSSNLNERKKQIGMLRTVGATRRQIVKVYGREAYIISFVCAPVSLVISYLLVLGVSKLLGEQFCFVPNWWVLIACTVFGVVCVMLAALIPLYAASRISPMQAIRNIEYTYKLKRKKIKSQKNYNTSSLLAKRGNAFHRTKQIAVCTILVITIIFSCYAFSFTTAMIREGNPYSINYDYEVFINGTSSSGYTNEYINVQDQAYGFNEQELYSIQSNQYVKSAHGAQACEAFMLFDDYTDYFAANYCSDADYLIFIDQPPFTLTKDNVDEYMRNIYDYRMQPYKQKYSYSNELLPSGIEAYSSFLFDEIKSVVVDGKINIDKINSGQEIVLYAPEKIAYKYSEEDYGPVIRAYTDDMIQDDGDYHNVVECNIKVGDKITLSVLTGDTITNEDGFPDNCERKDVEVTVGAIINQLPDNFHSEIGMGIYNNIKAITSLSGMKHFSENEKYRNINIMLNGEYDDKTHAEFQEFIKDISSEISNVEIRSVYQYNKETKQLNSSILISVISVVILLISISASIINNSMSAQIRGGKRQIGTLRAVGASQSVLVNSYIKQMLSIFIWSYGIGFLSYVISFIMQVIYIKSKNETPWLVFSPWQTILACIVLFGICSLNLWLKIRKEMKNSIIDNIREL